MQAEVELGRKRVQVGFMRRFDAEYAALAKIVSEGSMGEMLMLHCTHRNPDTPPGFTNEMLINDSVVHEFDIGTWRARRNLRQRQVRLPGGHAGRLRAGHR